LYMMKNLRRIGIFQESAFNSSKLFYFMLR
jgi:hypothetical protein